MAGAQTVRGVGLPSIRRRLSRGLRRFLRELNWRFEYRRLESLRELGRGRRAFLVGSGPSLAEMDLSRLAGEFVCVANMSLRAVGALLPHADMHVVTDTNRYRRFAAEIEALAARHAITYRFLNLRMRYRWRWKRRGARPYFIIVNPRKLVAGEPVPDLVDGVPTGATVLLSAAVLLDHLGFEAIYVLGCDLDYESQGKYFYAMGDLDHAHESDPDVIARRNNMAQVNGHFAVLRADFEKRGRKLFNAGRGGNLESLPRVDFDSLFSASA